LVAAVIAVVVITRTATMAALGLRLRRSAPIACAAKVEGYSLDAQKRAVRVYVESQGWDIYQEYVDEGVSARSDDVAKRPLFRQM